MSGIKVFTSGDCIRCGNFGTSDRPLCGGYCICCQRKYWADFQPILRALVDEHGEQFLKRMDVPPVYQGCSFANFAATTPSLKAALGYVTAWAKSSEGGLYLCGPVGVGKTHLAVAAMREFRAGKLGGFQFTPVQELIASCRDSFRQNEGERDKPSVAKILERLSHLSVLCLDDLGAENGTDFARETLGLLIDRIYRDRQTRLIVTSNLDLKELGNKLDGRTADRILELCLAVRVQGTSYRQKIAAERAAEMAQPAKGSIQ